MQQRNENQRLYRVNSVAAQGAHHTVIEDSRLLFVIHDSELWSYLMIMLERNVLFEKSILVSPSRTFALLIDLRPLLTAFRGFSKAWVERYSAEDPMENTSTNRFR